MAHTRITPEGLILRKCCDELANLKIFFWRQNNVPVYAQSNDGQYRFRALPKHTPRGLPDIFLVVRGQIVGIEVKVEGRPLRSEQRDFGDNLTIAGGRYFVVHSVDELSDVLLVLGL